MHSTAWAWGRAGGLALPGPITLSEGLSLLGLSAEEAPSASLQSGEVHRWAHWPGLGDVKVCQRDVLGWDSDMAWVYFCHVAPRGGGEPTEELGLEGLLRVA
jgi:hypothetical protein